MGGGAGVDRATPEGWDGFAGGTRGGGDVDAGGGAGLPGVESGEVEAAQGKDGEDLRGAFGGFSWSGGGRVANAGGAVVCEDRGCADDSGRVASLRFGFFPLVRGYGVAGAESVPPGGCAEAGVEAIASDACGIAGDFGGGDVGRASGLVFAWGVRGVAVD